MHSFTLAGFKVSRRTEFSNGVAHNGCDYDVLLLDSFGELGRFYGIADVAFIGSSLVPINERRGGHNLLEPLVHGVPPLFGPHMNLWRPVTQKLLNVWPSLEVNSAETLAESASQVFKGKAPLSAIGEVGMQLVELREDAVERTMAFLQDRGGLF